MTTNCASAENLPVSDAVALDDAMLVNAAVEAILRKKIDSAANSSAISDKEWKESGIPFPPERCNEIWAALCSSSWTLAQQDASPSAEASAVPESIEYMPLARMAYLPTQGLQQDCFREIMLSRIIRTKQYLGKPPLSSTKERKPASDPSAVPKKSSRATAAGNEEKKRRRTEPKSKMEGRPPTDSTDNNSNNSSKAIPPDPSPPSASSSCQQADPTVDNQTPSAEVATPQPIGAQAQCAASEDPAAMQVASPTAEVQPTACLGASSVLPAESTQDVPAAVMSEGAEQDMARASSSDDPAQVQIDHGSVQSAQMSIRSNPN